MSMRDYKRDPMRRHRVDMKEIQEEAERRQRRGTRFTYFSFIAAIVFLSMTKAMKPGTSIMAPAMAVAGVALGCIILIRLGRRKKNK